MSTTLIAAIAGIAGVLLGGVSRLLEARHARKQEAKALLSALVAEVEALTRLARHRGFIEGFTSFRDAAAQMIAAGQGQHPAPTMTLKLAYDYFAVFNASVSKIGALNPYMADRITRFYVFAKAALENVHPDAPSQSGVTAHEALEMWENDLQLLHTMMVLGDHIAGFRKMAPPRGIVDPFPLPAAPTVTVEHPLIDNAMGTGAE